MRTILILCIFAVSISVNAQTFIGRTQDDIVSQQKKSGNKLTQTNNDSLFTNLTFEDSKHNVTHFFSFSKKNVCVVYSIWTYNKIARDSVQKNIEKICQEKLTDKAWVQKLNGNVYSWNIQGSGDQYSFTTTQIKQ